MDLIIIDYFILSIVDLPLWLCGSEDRNKKGMWMWWVHFNTVHREMFGWVLLLRIFAIDLIREYKTFVNISPYMYVGDVHADRLSANSESRE